MAICQEESDTLRGDNPWILGLEREREFESGRAVFRFSLLTGEWSSTDGLYDFDQWFISGPSTDIIIEYTWSGSRNWKIVLTAEDGSLGRKLVSDGHVIDTGDTVWEFSADKVFVMFDRALDEVLQDLMWPFEKAVAHLFSFIGRQALFQHQRLGVARDSQVF